MAKDKREDTMTITLMESIDVIKGIGPRTAEEFQKLGVYSIQDILNYFPFRYEDRTCHVPSKLIDGQQITIVGLVEKKPHIQRRGKMSRLIATLTYDAMTHIQCVWFNQPYLLHTFVSGTQISVTGKYSAKHKQIAVSNYEILAKQTVPIHSGGTVPVYMGTKGLNTNTIRKWVSKVLLYCSDQIQDHLPIELQCRYKLVDKKTAYQWIHFPADDNECSQARRRLVYEEFFFYQVELQWVRNTLKDQKQGIAHTYDRQLLTSFVKGLPFALTNAQKTSLKEILTDMKSNQPMYRLLHGDVGVGKTMVATIALLANWTSKYQGAFMVPTEILATQHFATLTKDMDHTGVRICVLTSKCTKKERQTLIQGIKNNQYDIVIGTHALLQEDVIFSALGLVVIDEQHRFGVHQRKLLTLKGRMPDVLSMTATPIPRTMAMTIYGDFDVSVLNELPKGRKPVKTEWYTLAKEYEVLEKLTIVLDKKQQVYIVCPLIDESEQIDIENVNTIAERVQKYFVGYHVGIVHGRLAAKEKDAIMDEFVRGAIHILVATTVIEVGVNIASASAIVIYNAERFGLAQLHQLRGRVGRSDQDAYCYLLTDATSKTSKKRMQAMVASNDGFYLAEQDLLLRGPGEILGTRQSGLPEFKIGDIIEDYTIMQVARKDAIQFINDHNTAEHGYLEYFKTGSNFLA